MTIDHDTEKEQTWLQRTAWVSVGILGLVLVAAVIDTFLRAL